MRVTIVGAGAIGLNLAARLSSGGTRIRLVTRRPAAAARLAREGIALEDAATGESRTQPIAEVTDLGRASDLDRDPLLICVRADETEALAEQLHAAAPGAIVASAQNDVDNEAVLARRFEPVIGVVVRQTCTLRDTCRVAATGAGRIVVGRHPGGASPVAAELADAFEAAGFDVGRSEAIGRDKWLKLVHNLMSSVNALVRKPDHTTEAFVALKVRLLEEAREALDAAGIEATSCDGRDRDIADEIAHLHASLADGTSVRHLPLYNACWAALRDPARPLEADAYHRRIVELAAAHGTRAPANAVLQGAVTEAYRSRLGPERLGAEALLSQVRAARSEARR